jgi:hypothetical protein
MTTKKGKAKPKRTLEQLLVEVRDATERWKQNAKYAAVEGHYIEAQLALERAHMLDWVLEEADRDG